MLTEAVISALMIDKNQILDNATELNLLGVDYVHVKTADEGDLYLTKHGVPFAEHVHPDNWYEKSWFQENREKLLGTSTVYRVRTREIDGLSKDIVVKWCRVGEVIPLDTHTLSEFVDVEFNSPYEEFSLVMEMRERPSGGLVRTHKPMAIYVPGKRLKLWQTGRSESRIQRKKAKFRDVELDIYRQYILIYEWVKGISCIDAFMEMVPDMDTRRAHIMEMTKRGTEELETKGFRVLDMKPEHFIVRPQPDGDLLRNSHGDIAYALVDFELLERTPQHEQEVTAARRAEYLKHQKDRFVEPVDIVYPEHLRPTRVLDVDYVYGHSESTQGGLWVVGLDPTLFDYFVPERWRRTHRQKVSSTNESYWTKTKDNINLVWKVSRVGETPEVDETTDAGRKIVEYGYNSPFEEVSIAQELAQRGIPVIYPRVVYMTGQEAMPTDYHFDNTRYKTHEHVKTPNGHPILRPEHNYIIVWGYWNGMDELLARQDLEYCRGINLDDALDQRLITAADHSKLLARAAKELRDAGFEDLNPKGTHVMLSLAPGDKLICESNGQMAIRICNFSLMKKL